MKKPIIGISGSIIHDNCGQFANYPRSYVNDDYIDAVLKAGGIPFIIPFNTDEEVIKNQIDCLDGLILSGGHDISPRFYKEEPRQKMGETFYERDIFDFNLVKYAEAKNIPIFGICRGFQILNVYHGGSIQQDLTYSPNELLQHFQVDKPTDHTHHVKLVPDGFLFKEFKESKILVNSFHHQVIKKLAENLTSDACSDDGVCEAFINKQYNNLEFAVQWHPEMLHRVDEHMQHLFNILVRSCCNNEKE